MKEFFQMLNETGYLVPSVFLALLALIFQGIKAVIDIITHIRTRKIAKEQRMINLATALLNLVDASSKSEGEKIVIKEKLVDVVLRDVLTDEIKETMA